LRTARNQHIKVGLVFFKERIRAIGKGDGALRTTSFLTIRKGGTLGSWFILRLANGNPDFIGGASDSYTLIKIRCIKIAVRRPGGLAPA